MLLVRVVAFAFHAIAPTNRSAAAVAIPITSLRMFTPFGREASEALNIGPLRR